jgi:predicted RNA-binding Zn ribbon-like protein
MLARTPRRSDAARLRQTISQLLDHLYAVEHSMDVFHRKGDQAELERAAESFNEMLGYVDALGDMLAEVRGKQRVIESA